MTSSIVVPAISTDDAVRYVHKECPQVLHGASVSRVYPVRHLFINWPEGEWGIVEPLNRPDVLNRNTGKPHVLHSTPTEHILHSLVHCGKLSARLRQHTDAQVGQQMFDTVWEELELTSTSMSIVVEATERLFRSRAGVRAPDEVFNDPAKLPSCPECGEEMMHYVGINEADFRKCVALNCGNKIEEKNG